MRAPLGQTFQIKDHAVATELRKIYHLLQQRVVAANLDLPNVAAALGQAFGDGQIAALNRVLDAQHTGRRMSLNATDDADVTLRLRTEGSQPCLYLDEQGTPSNIIETSVGGCYLSAGGTWQSSSSRERKTNLRPVTLAEVVALLVTLELYHWEYRDKDGQPSGERHIGPMAEDVHQLFGVGDGEGLAAGDLAALALAAVQWLIGRVSELTERLERLEEQNASKT